MEENETIEEKKPENVAAIEEVISDSKAKIISQPEIPIKRGRGRPKKAQISGAEKKGMNSMPGSPEISAPVSVTPDISTPHPELKMFLQVPCQILAEARECPAWEMPDEVALSLTGPLHAVLEKYLPQMNGEHSALITLGIGIGSFGIGAWLSERKMKKEAAQNALKKAESDQARSKSMPTDFTSPFPVTQAL